MTALPPTPADALALMPPAATSLAANVASTAAIAATPALTPAAAARAKKLAGGGMTFLEQPRAVFMSGRNLAPPPPAPVPAVPDSSLAAAAAAPSSPAAASFSVVRWLCTSRSAWSWLVRALLVAGAVGSAFAAIKVYQAWLADMQRRHALRVAHSEAMQARAAAQVNNSAPSGTKSAASVAAANAAVSGADGAGLANFNSFVSLLNQRYQRLQRCAGVLKHVRFADATPAAGSPAESSVSQPVLTDVMKLKLMCDELDVTLAENAYLKDLLRRVHAQLE